MTMSIARVRAGSRVIFVRSGDALHLACAEEHGVEEVYTNDRHMLQAARHFHVTGVDILGDNG
jgi:predicted nucleic acid-binding protein